MLIHMKYTPEGGGQGVGLCGLPGLQRGAFAVLPLLPTPTPPRAPHRVSSPLLPARTLPGQWTAGGHSPSLPRASRSLGSDQAVRLAPRPASRGDSSPPGARPRHTFPIPSPAGAPSPVTWAGPRRRALPSELVWKKLEALVATWVHRGISPRVEPVSVFGGLRARNDCYPGVCKGMRMSVAWA